MEDIIQSIDPQLLNLISFGIIVVIAIIFILSAWHMRRAMRNIKTTTLLMNDAAKNLENSFSSLVKALVSIEELKKLQNGDKQIIPTEKNEKVS